VPWFLPLTARIFVSSKIHDLVSWWNFDCQLIFSAFGKIHDLVSWWKVGLHLFRPPCCRLRSQALEVEPLCTQLRNSSLYSSWSQQHELDSK
jgi:hypothetical protein